MKARRRGFFARLGHVIAAAVLLLALSALDFILGCSSKDEEPKYYYGCPADVCGEDVTLDGTTDVKVDEVEPPDLYGVPPVDVVDSVDVPDGADQKDAILPDTQVHYGPPPADYSSDPEMKPVYGMPDMEVYDVDNPEPADAVTDAGHQDTGVQPEMMPLYGIPTYDLQATDEVAQDLSTKDCPPAGWYGPMPCESDEECQQQYGADYYCNEDATIPSPCDDGKPMKYPTCEPKK